MIDSTIIGIIAGCFTTAASLPQLIQAWRTKETKALSLLMLITWLIGAILWTAYGIIIKDFALIYFSAVAAGLIFTLTGLKIKYK